MINEMLEEVIEYIIDVFGDEARNFDYLKNMKFKRKELYNVVGNCFAFQIYYDEEVNKLYLFYELNDLIKNVTDQVQYCLQVNSRLNNTFKERMKMYIEILGPYSLVRSGHIPPIVADQSELLLRPYTFSYWRCFDKTYRFVQDKQRFLSDHNIYFNPTILPEDRNKEQEFIDSLMEINNKYNFNNNNEDDFKKAFEEYKVLYKNFYNRELKNIDQDKVVVVYLDTIFTDEI